jgi:hypothetical protein
MKLDILVQIEAFAKARITRPGMDHDDTRGTYCALRGQRGNEAGLGVSSATVLTGAALDRPTPVARRTRSFKPPEARARPRHPEQPASIITYVGASRTATTSMRSRFDAYQPGSLSPGVRDPADGRRLTATVGVAVGGKPVR